MPLARSAGGKGKWSKEKLTTELHEQSKEYWGLPLPPVACLLRALSFSIDPALSCNRRCPWLQRTWTTCWAFWTATYLNQNGSR